MSGIVEKASGGKPRLIIRLVILTTALMVLFGLYRFNFLLFHSVVEIFGVVVAGAIFMFAWNARQFVATSYFTIIGVGYLAVAIIDFLHTFTYPGMVIIPNLRQDAGIQLWIAARFVESATLFLALVFVRRKLNDSLWPLISIGISLAISATILVWPIFPTCFIPGKGLTLFKISSEYLIIIILLASVQLLRRNRQLFETDVWQLLVGAIWVTIVSELAFTLYTDVYGFFNVVGHYLKFISVFLIYQAIIKTGMMKPYRLVVNALKQREADIEEKEAKFRLLVEKVEGAFWIAAVDFQKFLYISPGYEKIWQRPCSQLYADPQMFENSIHPEDRKRVMSAVSSVPKGGWDVAFRIIRPDGGERWIRDHGYPVKEAGGEVRRLCGMAHDITKQKRLEQKLLQAGQTLEHRVAIRTNALSTVIGYLKEQVKERSKIGAELKERNLMLKTLVQAIPDMVSYKDPQGRYLIANSAHRSFFGLKGAPVIGHTDQSLGTNQMEEDNAERERTVLEEGRAIRFECIMRSATGCTSHWDIRKVPVKNSGGDNLGVLSLARDISPFKQREFELQQSKTMLQAFLNGISDPMLMIDTHLHVVYSNRAAAKAFSLNIQGDNAHICNQILRDDSGQCNTSRLQALMASKKPASFELNRADTHRIEKVYIYPFSDEACGMDGAVLRIADITEAKGLERHLMHSEKMNALGMLVAGMVHEINNPNSFISFNLPILRAYLEKMFKMLDSHPATATHKDWFGMDYPSFRKEMFSLTDNLSHGSSRIDNIISNLKTMTHPRQISTQIKWVDLLDVIDKAVVLCRSEIRKRVKVFEVTPPPHPIEINTDPEALEQVIINLLINASHAADKRESWVRLVATSSADKRNQAVIEVSDNGCGMTQETMARIFDPFYTTKGPGVGTGLGLSVSYNLICQIGGEILVDSTLDEGTRFKLVLPLEAEAASGPRLGLEKKMDAGPYLGTGNQKRN